MLSLRFPAAPSFVAIWCFLFVIVARSQDNLPQDFHHSDSESPSLHIVDVIRGKERPSAIPDSYAWHDFFRLANDIYHEQGESAFEGYLAGEFRISKKTLPSSYDAIKQAILETAVLARLNYTSLEKKRVRVAKEQRKQMIPEDMIQAISHQSWLRTLRSVLEHRALLKTKLEQADRDAAEALWEVLSARVLAYKEGMTLYLGADDDIDATIEYERQVMPVIDFESKKQEQQR